MYQIQERRSQSTVNSLGWRNMHEMCERMVVNKIKSNWVLNTSANYRLHTQIGLHYRSQPYGICLERENVTKKQCVMENTFSNQKVEDIHILI